MVAHDASGKVPRFAQLTYSSFDAGVERGAHATGGWQVKETRGALDPLESETLRSQVATQFDAGVELPMFPTAEEIDALPRRLVYAPAVDGSFAYWHTAPAGVDGSGRPGNVFAHVLLDRQPASASESWRPVDLWRSPDWLTPYNAGAVLSASLGPWDHPRPGSAVTRGPVLDFVLDPTCWRVGVLTGLLDAVAAALAGGPRIVLGVEDVDSAALWIGAVSHLMSAGTSRSLSFSTLERPAGLAAAWAKGVHLACVPRSDLGALKPGPDVVVIDETETLEMGAVGGAPHVTERGSLIAATPWSALAQVALQDPDTAFEALAALDEIAVTVGDTGLSCAWPLAMAALRLPDLAGDAQLEAAQVISRATPDRLQDHPELLGLARESVRSFVGRDAEHAWACVAPATSTPRPVLQRLVLQVYVDRAIRDGEWLLRRGGVPLPEDADAITYDGAVDTVLGTVSELEQRARAVGDDDEQRVLAAQTLRLYQLVWQVRLLDEPSSAIDALNERFTDLVERLAVPLYLDELEGPRLIELVQPVVPRIGAANARSLLSQEVENRRSASQGSLGARAYPELLAHVGWKNEWRGRALSDIVAVRAAIDPLDAEFAALSLARRAAGDGPDDAYRRLGTVAVLAELAAGRPVAVDVAEAFDRQQFDADDLAVLVRAFGDAVPEGALVRTVLSERWTEGLAALCEAIEPATPLRGGPSRDPEHRTTPRLSHLIDLRRRAAMDLARSAGERDVKAGAENVVRLAGWLQGWCPAGALAADAVAQVRAAVVAAALLGGEVTPSPAEAGWHDLLTRPLPPEESERLVRLLTGWLTTGLLRLEVAAFAAVGVLPRFPVPGAVPHRFAPLASVQGALDGAPEPVLDQALRLSLRERERDVARIAESVARLVETELMRQRRSEREIDDAFSESWRFTEARLKQLAPKGGGLLNGAISRFRRT